MTEGTTIYCGDHCNHTGPHRYPLGLSHPMNLPDTAHEHRWENVGTERNFGGSIGWVIQACACGVARRVTVPPHEVSV